MSVILLCKITHLFKKFQGFPIQSPFSGIILFCVCETLNSEKILIKKYCCVLFRPLISKADFEPLAKDDSMFPLGSCYAVHWFVVKWQKRNRPKGSYILSTRTTKRPPTCWRPRNRLGAQTSSFSQTHWLRIIMIGYNVMQRLHFCVIYPYNMLENLRPIITWGKGCRIW